MAISWGYKRCHLKLGKSITLFLQLTFHLYSDLCCVNYVFYFLAICLLVTIFVILLALVGSSCHVKDKSATLVLTVNNECNSCLYYSGKSADYLE